jgi:hypothetical protein
MNYAVEMALGGMIYIRIFINTIWEFRRFKEDTHTDREFVS